MSRQLFGVTGQKVEIAHLDAEEPEKLRIETFEDLGPVLAKVREASENDTKPHEAMRLEAVVPAHIVGKAMREGWYHDPVAWRRWCNDPQNRPFRVERNNRVKTL